MARINTICKFDLYGKIVLITVNLDFMSYQEQTKTDSKNCKVLTKWAFVPLGMTLILTTG